MREETWGGLRVRIVGGTDREGGGTGPAVFLLHGFGAPGDDLVPLWRVLDVPSEVRFVFPEGPLSLPIMHYGAARAWWMIDLEAIQSARREGRVRDRRSEYPEALPAVREQLRAMLDEAQSALGVEGERVVLGGFSQGSMAALDLALHDERSLAGLVLLSSTLLAEDEWAPRMPSRRGLPVLQSHGSQDELLPFELAVALQERLTEAGLDVTWLPFEDGHTIPASVIESLGEFLRRALPL